MKILGIDPGKRQGWAAHDNEIVGSGVMDGRDFVEVKRLLDVYQPDVIICEDSFIKYRKGAAGLSFYRHAWETIVLQEQQLNGRKIEFAEPVNPSTWQAYFRIKKGDKRAMVVLATKLCGRPIEVDEADAVLIVSHYAAVEQAAAVISNTTKRPGRPRNPWSLPKKKQIEELKPEEVRDWT
jgi:Holliday junction resolvasome RuvABC endonuclease subunit